MSLSEVIKTALDQIQTISKTQTIIGEPISAGEVTLIPVSKVTIGFAAGGGGADISKGANGAGTGGGVNITPVAFISVCGDKVQIHSLSQSEAGFSSILSMAPDVISKITKYFKKKDEITPESDT